MPRTPLPSLFSLLLVAPLVSLLACAGGQVALVPERQPERQPAPPPSRKPVGAFAKYAALVRSASEGALTICRT